jgi:riboflavin kinase/FMN adenylyltransferase
LQWKKRGKVFLESKSFGNRNFLSFSALEIQVLAKNKQSYTSINDINVLLYFTNKVFFYPMNVVHGIENYVFTSKSILTIGTFDGVHLGHQKIIQKLVKKARDQKLQANLLTFFSTSQNGVAKRSFDPTYRYLGRKEQLLRKLGIDNLIIHPFTKEFSKLSAVEFTRDVLVNQLGISSLFIGYDHRFGKNREATVEDLISYGKTYNFQVTMIPAQDIASITVSSTKIRNA